MNDLLLIGSAIYSKLVAGSVTTYYAKAPQTVQPPFCIIQFVSGNDDYHFNERGLNAVYQIKAISDRNFPEQAIGLFGTVHNLIQDASLSLSGYDVIRVRRDSIFQYEDPQHFWNVGGLYMIDTWQQ